MSTFCPRPEPLGAAGLVGDGSLRFVVLAEAPVSSAGSEFDTAATCAPPPATGGRVEVELEEIEEAIWVAPFGRLIVADYTPQSPDRQTTGPCA